MNDFIQFYINLGYSELEAKELYRQYLKRNSVTVGPARPAWEHNPHIMTVELKKLLDRFKLNKNRLADALMFGMTPHKNLIAANVGAENLAENLLSTIILEGINAGLIRPVINAFNNSAYGTLWNMAHNRVPLYFNNTVNPRVISYVPRRIQLNLGYVNSQEPSYNMIHLTMEDSDKLKAILNAERRSSRRIVRPSITEEVLPNPKPVEEQTVESVMNDALAYWTSPERQALNELLKQEAYEQGFLSDAPVENSWEDGSLYALWLNRELPSIEMDLYLRAKGEYNPNFNVIRLKRLDPYTLYHEGIHAYGAIDPSRALFSAYFKPSFPYLSVINTAKFKQSKVNSILKPEFQYDPNKLLVSELLGLSPSRKVLYNSDPDELVAYGLTAGRMLGIRPFEPFVSALYAEQLWAEAVKRVPFLKAVREDISPELKWKILTGTFLSILPVVPTILINDNNYENGM